MSGAIAILDNSPVTPEDVLSSVRALNAELMDFCEKWRVPYWRVYPAFDANRIPETHFRHTLLHDSDQYPEWSGWHSSGGVGSPSSTTLTKHQNWTVTADHENKEMRINPDVDLWLPWPGEPNWMCAKEVCDPVQADWKSVAVYFYGRTRTINLSNYVLPNWFVEKSEPPYDAFGWCKRPGEIRPGGYLPIRNRTTGARENAWGSKLPIWSLQKKKWLEHKMQGASASRSALV